MDDMLNTQGHVRLDFQFKMSDEEGPRLACRARRGTPRVW